ncbi:protein canopy 4-like isoform X2 [Paramacrobiotus metropolitanus]|nr:protein canopy 4-like isoform X2 [Paramacrobiotus metropolitanus]
MEEKMQKTAAKLKLDLGSRPEGPDSRKLDYSRSELRLIEILDTACDDVSQYYVHVKDGMQRFAKQESETLDALNSLRRKGVKVEIGMPWEIVDKQANKEIMALKRKCEEVVEKYEDDLSAWYFQQQDTKPLTDFICRDRLLKKENQTCLDEKWQPYGDRPVTTEEEKEQEREEGRQKVKKWKQEELEGKDKEWQEIKNRKMEL